jgi:hypothetical protein
MEFNEIESLGSILDYHTTKFNKQFSNVSEEDLHFKINKYVMEYITLENVDDLLPYVMNVRFMIYFTQTFMEYVIPHEHLCLEQIYLYCARKMVKEYIEVNYPYKYGELS